MLAHMVQTVDMQKHCGHAKVIGWQKMAYYRAHWRALEIPAHSATREENYSRTLSVADRLTVEEWFPQGHL